MSAGKKKNMITSNQVIQRNFRKLGIIITYISLLSSIVALFFDTWVFPIDVLFVNLMNAVCFFIELILLVYLLRTNAYQIVFLISAYIVSINIYITAHFNFPATDIPIEGAQYAIVLLIYVFAASLVGKKNHTVILSLFYIVNLTVQYFDGIVKIDQLILSGLTIIPFVLVVYYVFYLLEKSFRENDRIHQTIMEQNRELTVLQSFKDDLTHMIAHDLKNALNTIINISASESRDAQKRIYEIGTFSLRLTTNMLDVKRMREADMKPDLKPHSLHNIVSIAVNKLSFWTKQRNIAVRLSFEHDVLVNTDVDLTVRILINLLDNALKASENNETIIVKWRIEQQKLIVSVCDNGHGFSVEQLQSLFTKFETVAGLKAKNMLSTGLGLAFCKLAVEKLNGKIWVEKTGAQGTEICLTLPYIASQTVNKRVQEGTHNQILSKADKQQLQAAAKKMLQLKYYQTKAIFEVLNDISPTGDAQNQWIEQVKNSVFTGNENQYKFMVNQIFSHESKGDTNIVSCG